MRRFVRRMWALVTRRQLDSELDGEVLAHLELAEREALATGMSPEEARRTARVRFGRVEQMKEEHRDRRSVRWIDNLARDFRYGLASLVRNPGFSVIAIGVLALGIGANTAMFSLVDAVMLKPLPFPGPDRMVRVWEEVRPGVNNVVTTLNFVDWKRLNTVFKALSAQSYSQTTLTSEGEPVMLRCSRVSADYFEVFGVGAGVGRTFLPGEDQPGADPVVVLSDAGWRSYFGSDPDILDRELTLDGEPHRVVGVLARGAMDRDWPALWTPLVFSASDRTRSSHWLRVVGRLRDGVTLAQAQEEMRAIDQSLTELEPEWKRDWGVTVEPFAERLVGDGLRRTLYVALGAVLLVLLIACSNVANLLLAKGAARRREMAVRAALGASRGRLVAQLLTESVVLCLSGGVAGLVVAYLFLQAATRLLAASLPFTAEIALDLRVLGFAVGVALVVSLLVGLFPAIEASFTRLSQSMNRGSRGASDSRERLRRAMVAGEVAVSLVLLCGALLLFESLLKLQQVDPGVRIENVTAMSVSLPEAAYPTAGSVTRFYQAVKERVAGVPGVEQAAMTTDLPLQPVGEGEALMSLAYDASVDVRYKRIDEGYFDTLRIPVLAGRGISNTDREGTAAIVVINETLARRLSEELGFDDPVGEAVRISTPIYGKKDGVLAETRIVGLIRNEQVGPPGAPHEPVAYVPLAQVPAGGARLLVRASGEPASVIPAIREAVWDVDPNLALGDVSTLEQIRDQGYSGTAEPAWVIGAFAAVAALLAALGLYGVLAHTVAQQRREIGIRMALGAERRDVVVYVLRAGISMILVGLALGIAGVFVLTRAIESLLFGVSALDPVALGAACAAMLAIGLLAGFVPARRAARVDPMSVLREEG